MKYDPRVKWGPKPKCIVPHCARASRGVRGGLCATHSARNPGTQFVKSQYEKSERERFWEKVDKAGECWIWIGSKYSKLGYGGFRSTEINPDGISIAAHRVSYYYEHGVYSTGRDFNIDHLCRNTMCVRPDHLEMVSARENVMRGIGPTSVNAKKTHCKRGHEFAEGSFWMNGNGRKCKECHRSAARRFLAKKRGDS